MLAVMAQVLPIAAVVPIHGVIQLGSNFGRSALLAKFIDYRSLLWFSVGCLLGAIAGGQIVWTLSSTFLQVLLGSFILFSTWGIKPKLSRVSSSGLAFGGLITTVLTLFVGATGPFVLAMLKTLKNQDRMQLVANTAAFMSIQHILKILVFGMLGFQFADYFGLICMMLVSGLIGTYLGKQALIKVQEDRFQKILNIGLTVLALRLIFSNLPIW